MVNLPMSTSAPQYILGSDGTFAEVINGVLQVSVVGGVGVTGFSAPAAMTVTAGTAFQAPDPTKPTIISVTITSTANFSLTGGTTNTADVLIGSTAAVATGTGTTVGSYANSITGTIAIGLNMNSLQTNTYILCLPAGWYGAVRQTAGTISIVRAFGQAMV